MIRRRSILVPVASAALVAFLVVAAAGTAAAQDIGQVTDDVVFRGYAVAVGADVDIDEIEASLASLGEEVAVVVLAADAASGADRVADEVRRGVARELTVLVISPGEVGATSDRVGDAVLDAALDGVIDDLAAGLGIGATTVRFAEAIDAASDGSGSGAGASVLVVIAVAAVVAAGGVLVLRRRARRADARDVDTARSEIRAQLEAVATEILENADAVDRSADAEAIALFREANAAYVRIGDAIEGTTDLSELAGLGDEVDRARWQLEAAEALVEGRTPPPPPEPDAPAACFFDPTHKPGTVEATLRTPAGDKDVRVCGRCAERLERGEVPEPRMIDVGGRRVPAARAPRSHGGLGMGGLSVFDLVLGGLAGTVGNGRGRGSAGAGIDWGRLPGGSRPSRRSSDPFGISRVPSRSRSRARTRVSRPSGRRPTPSKGSARGRARRRR